MVCKRRRFHEANDLITVTLSAVRPKENDRRRPEYAEAIQEQLVLIIVGCYVSL
jgi:hypothetical protein